MDTYHEKAHIFGSLFALANRIQILGDKIDERMTIKQWLLLAMISQCKSKSPSISEISHIIGNSKQNVKKMSLILEKRGFVTVKKDNCDNRIVRVTITKQCEEYFNGIYERSKDFIENLFQGFDDEILKIFYNGFIRLENNVIKMEDLYKDEKGGIE